MLFGFTCYYFTIYFFRGFHFQLFLITDYFLWWACMYDFQIILSLVGLSFIIFGFKNISIVWSLYFLFAFILFFFGGLLNFTFLLHFMSHGWAKIICIVITVLGWVQYTFNIIGLVLSISYYIWVGTFYLSRQLIYDISFFVCSNHFLIHGTIYIKNSHYLQFW